jgi:ABC-type sugar transport system ATPase subunit
MPSTTLINEPDVQAAPLISLRDIRKTFGAVKVLHGVDLDVYPGTVTALCGDNGAGKSVLIKTIAGLWHPTSGTILWEGREVHLRSPAEAEALGITTIYQDLSLCNNLDVVQNLFLGHEELRHGILDEDKMENFAHRALADLSVTTIDSVRQHVGSLSGGQRQSVAVARAVRGNAKLVIMDEPTAALGVTQTRVVLELIEHLSSTGIAVLMVSHNLNDVFQVADRIAVMYLGRIVADGPARDFDLTSVVSDMTFGGTEPSRQLPSVTSEATAIAPAAASV